MDEDDRVTSLLQLYHTYLDSHANVVAVVKNVAIINYTIIRSEVSSFTPDYESLSKVPIVEATIRCDCLCSG